MYVEMDESMNSFESIVDLPTVHVESLSDRMNAEWLRQADSYDASRLCNLLRLYVEAQFVVSFKNINDQRVMLYSAQMLAAVDILSPAPDPAFENVFMRKLREHMLQHGVSWVTVQRNVEQMVSVLRSHGL